MTTTTTTQPPSLLAHGPQSSSAEKQEAYLSSLGSKHAAALWTVLDKMVPPRPQPTAVSAAWKYADMRPPLMEAGDLISAEDAERRVLMLVNPSLEAPYTTDTIYAGLQLILPGETAPAHRHVASALRFIIEGSGGFTAVEGEKLGMERGDVLITPSWHWHDHGNEGTEPMIWLDGLDLPVYRFLPINFAENYAEDRYPSKAVASSKLRIPWSSVAPMLDEDIESAPYAYHQYRFPNGAHLSRTISCQAERLAAGSSSPTSQETCSFVYHVYQGRGHSVIRTPNGKEERIEWQDRDTFSVPAWSSVTHTCTMERGQAYLFAMNDRPMVESLGLVRKA